MTDTLVVARQAAENGSWSEALELLSGIEASVLSPDDHALLAEAAFWRGRMRESNVARESAYRGYLADGRRELAAGCAVRLARSYGDLREPALVAAWLKNAENALNGLEECAQHGRLQLELAHQAASGNVEGEPQAYLERALEIAAREHDKDTLALGLGMKGLMALHGGEVESGMRLLGEATIPAVSGELGPYATGVVYCMVISGSSAIADWQQAGQWTEAAKRWCDRQSINGFPGVCRVHRAEVMRLRGSFAVAEQEARTATEELLSFNLGAAGAAFRELGDVRLRLGDLDAAEAAFRQAHELGASPQPGMAQLQAARGKPGNAAASLRRALDEECGLIDRARMLTALIEVLITLREIDEAEARCAELADVAAGYRTDAMEATVLTSQARVLLARGDRAGAESAAKRALRLWRSVELLYDAAVAQRLLGEIYLEQGDKDAADFEFTSALSMFERFGAIPDADAVRGRRSSCIEAPVRADESVQMTFLFSDIVGSTSLVDAMGDDAWMNLLEWHDEQLRSCFAAHRGEVVAHTGDGFFVAFPSAGQAVACAIEIQRRLAAHRTTHGFAPQVRIGLHATEARRSRGNYHGKGIHEAARIGALAGAGEILASLSTAREADVSVRDQDVREKLLKGVATPARLVAIDWRDART